MEKESSAEQAVNQEQRRVLTEVSQQLKDALPDNFEDPEMLTHEEAAHLNLLRDLRTQELLNMARIKISEVREGIESQMVLYLIWGVLQEQLKQLSSKS